MGNMSEAYYVNRARLMAIYTNLIEWIYPTGDDAKADRWRLFVPQVFERYLMTTNAAATYWEERFESYISTKITSAGNLDINGYPLVYECIGVNYTRRMRRDDIAYCYNTTAGSASGVDNVYYFDILKIIRHYARLMANIDVGIYNETENTKHPAVISIGDSKMLKSVKEAWRQASDGEPVIFADKELISGMSTQLFPLPTETHFADKHAAKRVIVNEFLSTIGVNSLDFEKSERMITAEADAGREATTLCAVNLIAPREQFCERFARLYPDENLNFRFRTAKEINSYVNDTLDSDTPVNNAAGPLASV